jgi:cobalt-zinc-cadmium efflux system protein
MAHSHSHGHSHAPADFSRAFFIGIALNTGFVVAEVVAGFLANSVALLADAGHNFSDVLGLAMAWAGAAMARRPSSDQFTYGLKKAPILAALGNAVLLLVTTGAILLESIRRLVEPQTADATTVIEIAAAGIVINGVTAMLFASGRKRDLNIRAAFVHMAADAGILAGVLLAGIAMLLTGYQWIDPVVSIAVALVILWGTFDLLKESTWMSLAAVPPGMSLPEIEGALREVAGVEALHDLHVWPMSTTENALTVHLIVREESRRKHVLAAAGQLLEERFHLHHSTIQIEAEADGDCADC